jgi:hypothetical protein
LSTASLILAFLAILCVVLTVVLSYGLGARIIGQLGTEFTPEEVQRVATDPALQSSAVAVMAALAFSQLLALAGLILGIVGVSQEGKRPTQSGKALGIVGIVLSLLPLLCCVTLVLLYLVGAGTR